MVFGICHYDDNTFVVIVSLTREAPTQVDNTLDALVDVGHGDVEMNADLSSFRFGHRLENEPRLKVAAPAEVHPAVLRGTGFAIEEGAPEPGDALGVDTIDGDPGPDIHELISGRLPQ